MKKIVYISMGLLAILAISCSKKDSPVSTPTETAKQNLKEVSITVGAPEDIETKVAYAYDETEKKLKLTWEEGDKIVLQRGDQAYPFTATTISENGKMATFTGTSAGEGTYDVFYAGKGTEAMTLAEVEAMDYSVQTQSANDNTSHLKFAARLNGVTFTPGTDDIYFTADWAQEKGGTYQQSGAIRIRLQNPGVSGVKSVTLTAPSAIFPKTNALNNNEMGNSIAVNLPNASIAETDHIVVYAMLPWNDAGIALPAGEYKVTIVTDEYDVWTKSKRFEANTLSPVAVNSITLNKTGLNLQSFYGGQGTAEDPYLIANARQFKNISTLAATDDRYLDAHYRQIEDISFNGDITDSMIGSSEHPFSGTYVGYKDGAESKRKLRMLTITATDNAPAGVFRNVTGTIKHISVVSSTVSGEDVVGALVGTLNGGTVSDCVHSGNTVTGSSKVGGLVGEAKGPAQITNCETQTGDTVNPGSANYVGGIVGYVTSAEVTNCVNKANVTGGQFVGGIAGYFDDGLIDACRFAGGSVTGSGENVGGIAGYQAGGTLKRCVANASLTVTGLTSVGGLVGQMNANSKACLLIDCAAKSNVHSTHTTDYYGRSGGLVGTLQGSASYNAVIANSVGYAANIYNDTQKSAAGAIVARMDGNKNNTIVRNCYSQANSSKFVGYSPKKNGSDITACSHPGGIFGYCAYGTTLDCYYVKDGPGAGKVSGTTSNQYKYNLTQIINTVKNGTALVASMTFANESTMTNGGLGQIMNQGRWSGATEDTGTWRYSSSYGEESPSFWDGPTTKVASEYTPTCLTCLKELGDDYIIW